jgi:hypothetical protein
MQRSNVSSIHRTEVKESSLPELQAMWGSLRRDSGRLVVNQLR